MWEILFLFGIADQKELTYAALAEGPGAFIQAVINYRQKLGPGIKNDKIFGVTIHPEKGKYIEKSVFPYNNGRTENLWNKIVDLPPFKFDIKEDAIAVYKRFKEKEFAYS
jgi:hypothetical protein